MVFDEVAVARLMERLERERAAVPPAPPLDPPPNGGSSGGMDPWQTSVEKRLDSLDGRAQRLEADVSDIKVSVGVLTERVSHLPTKSWMATGLIGALGIITGLITFADKLHALVK